MPLNWVLLREPMLPQGNKGMNLDFPNFAPYFYQPAYDGITDDYGNAEP